MELFNADKGKRGRREIKRGDDIEKRGDDIEKRGDDIETSRMILRSAYNGTSTSIYFNTS